MTRGVQFGERLIAVAIEHICGRGRPDLKFSPLYTVMLTHKPQTCGNPVLSIHVWANGDNGTSLALAATIVESGSIANVLVVAMLTLPGGTEIWDGRMRQSEAGFIEVVSLEPVTTG